MNHAKIEVYSTTGCKHCKKAKAKLQSLGITDFNSQDVDMIKSDLSVLDGNALLEERFTYTKTRTVPQIFIGNELIGGCDDLLECIASGKFITLLEDHDIIAGQVVIPMVNEDENITNENINLSEEEIIEKYKDFVINNDPDGATGPIIEANPEEILALSESLQRQALILTDKYMNADGSRVRYIAMKKSDELKECIKLCSTLQRYRLDDFQASPENIRLSFFSNLYNAMIVQANCILGPPADTPASRKMFFSGTSGNRYNICGQIFSADDIEHGIIRGNHRHPGQPIEVSTFWKLDDPRCALSLKTLDPRVHFILNCGASSCPPIKVLGEEPEEALAAAAKSYLESESKITETTDTKKKIILTLPKLLLWYKADFGANVLEVVSKVASLLATDSPLYNKISSMLATVPEGVTEIDDINLPFEVDYGDYNWAINSEQ
mgnify:CR=1 FL=1